ncbi:MAG: serine hydrolase domain-containing protein [Candidatus Thorarchaeota archaeon]|jgi:CubicO group peptidase (beta-lactamase class C family)
MTRAHEKAFVTLSLFLFISCFIGYPSTSGSLQVGDYWPTEEWRISEPEDQGVNSTYLDSMLEFIENRQERIDSVLVIRNGCIVFEEYLNAYYDRFTRHTLQSISKSVNSALIGIAIREGLIESVAAKVVDFFPDLAIDNLDDRKRNMTIEHLLTMTTGLDWSELLIPYDDFEHNSLTRMHASDDAVQYTLNQSMAYQPGTEWAYCSGASIVLGAIIQQVSGMTTLEFAEEYLFSPLGIGDPYWLTAPGGWLHTGGGLYMTPRDTARFGLLYLNNGTWDGEQIVPANYVEASGQTHYYQFGIGANYGYGYQWWTFPSNGIYYGYGNMEQKLYIVPEHDLVVVINSSYDDNERGPTDWILFAYIIRSIDRFAPLPPTEPESSPTVPVEGVLIGVSILLIILVVLAVRRRS